MGLEREHLRLRRMELPEAKGTYVLIAFAGQMTRLEIGRLGTFAIVPGFYAKRQPAFRWFEQALWEQCGGVRPERCRISACLLESLAFTRE